MEKDITPSYFADQNVSPIITSIIRDCSVEFLLSYFIEEQLRFRTLSYGMFPSVISVCLLCKIKRKMQTTPYAKPLRHVLFAKWALHKAAVKFLSFQLRQLAGGRVCLLLARGFAFEFLARVICFSIYSQIWHVQFFNDYFYNLKTELNDRRFRMFYSSRELCSKERANAPSILLDILLTHRETIAYAWSTPVWIKLSFYWVKKMPGIPFLS